MSLRRVALMMSFCLIAAPAAEGQPRIPKIEQACLHAEPSGFGRILAESPPGMIALGDGPLAVRLISTCAEGSSDLAARVRAAPPRRRLLLVIDDLRAIAQPGVLFDLKLGHDRAAARGGGTLIGTLNFFAAQRPGVDARPRRVSYDVTGVLHGLVERGRWPGDLVLTIQPQRAPESGAGVAIGHIVLVEQ